MANYSCCQGYVCDCSLPGVQSCPLCCLVCESYCCAGCALSATRLLVMDQYNLGNEPCDNRLIRFNNCVQCIACILEVLNKDIGAVARLIADIVWFCISGCMVAQINTELNYRAALGKAGPGAQSML